MTFLEYLVLLQRRWRAVVSMTVIGLLIALNVSLLTEPRYVAAATSFVTVTDEEAAGAGEVFQGSQFVTQRMVSYAALSSSPEVVDNVIDELDLELTPRELRQMMDVDSPTGSVLLKVSVEHTDAQQAADIADEVSRQLAVLIEEVETPRGLAASSVEVTLTHPAVVPPDPSSPREKLNLLLGLVGGAAAGLLLALLREHVDRRITSVRDLRAITGARPLGSTVASGSAHGDPLIAADSRSVQAERYRNIKTALKVAHRNSALHHVVISSPTQHEGRSSETANLAISWALGGARVCVVDADLRGAGVSRVFGAGSAVGLSDVLGGAAELDTTLISWNDGAVTVLPAGLPPEDPAELLGSKAMTVLTNELRSRFDVVIYDAGPVLETADAVVLARNLDGLVLVVRAGTTTRDELEDCLEIVREARVPLLGTVLAGVRTRRRGQRRKGAAHPERRPHGASRQRAELGSSV
jgi:polysaccharide biosynthesis transport protein